MTKGSPDHTRTNIRLGGLALMLGLLALAVGELPRRERVSIDPGELAYMIQNELDHVTAEELSGWIKDGEPDLRLIDLRDPHEFASKHIPGAENMELTKLVEVQFDREQEIVLYSEGGIHAAQAMFLLWARGHKKVYTLKGGMGAWEEFEDSARFAANPENGRKPSARSPRQVRKDIPETMQQDSLSKKRMKVLPERERMREEC